MGGEFYSAIIGEKSTGDYTKSGKKKMNLSKKEKEK